MISKDVNIAVFTPTTYYGGLDVVESSLARQVLRNFVWIITDELRDERKEIHFEIGKRLQIPVFSLIPPEKNDKRRNLCAAYNAAFSLAWELGSTLFVSLQDYIYLESWALQRFAEIHKRYPGDLITGVTHISADPPVSEVVDYKGLYTIFERPYRLKPQERLWTDVRDTEIYEFHNSPRIQEIQPVHWEANWAAAPTSLVNEGIMWDEEYDKGVAYENMDLAMRAKQAGHTITFDRDNVAISLPHKKYFPELEADDMKYSNQEFFHNKWGW